MQQTPVQAIVVSAFTGPVRNLFLGGSLCYAVQQEKYWHIPVLLLFPSVYAGYNLFKNKTELLNFVVATKRQIQ